MFRQTATPRECFICSRFHSVIIYSSLAGYCRGLELILGFLFLPVTASLNVRGLLQVAVRGRLEKKEIKAR